MDIEQSKLKLKIIMDFFKITVSDISLLTAILENWKHSYNENLL